MISADNIKKYYSCINRKKIYIYLEFLFLILILLPFSNGNKLGWLCTFFVVFAVISNDSIQAIGTYIISHNKSRWYKIYLFISSIFVSSFLISWLFFDKGVSFNILKNIEYSNDFRVMYLISPMLLLIMNFYSIPASSTFLILSMFISSAGVSQMLIKTCLSYVYSIVVSFLVWFIINLKFKKYVFSYDLFFMKKQHLKMIQRISTFCLTFMWLTLIAGNMTVFIPRKLEIYDLIYFLLIVISVLFVFIRNREGRINRILLEDVDLRNIKVSIVVNIIFIMILYFNKIVSNTTMATTFVLFGIVCGKQMVNTILDKNMNCGNKLKQILFLIYKHCSFGLVGILISLIYIKFCFFEKFLL